MSDKSDLPLNESNPSKPHLSSSSLGLFLRCPEAYRRRYVEKEAGKSNMAMIKGKAFHAAVDGNMNAKIDTGKALPMKYLVQIMTDKLSDELQDSEEDDDNGEHASSLTHLLRAHHHLQAPDYKPTAAEVGFRIELDSCGHDYVGYIDMIGELTETGEPVIVDWKTSGKKPANRSQHDSDQLTGYYASQSDELGEKVELRLDCLVGGKSPKVKRHVLPTRRDGEDLVAFAQKINIASKVINQGLFPPASSQSWWCSASWCQFHSTCKYVNPNRRTKELAREKVEEAVKLISINEKEQNDE